MKEKKHGLSESLENVARIARATAWNRFIHSPLRYITGQFFNKIIYPFSKEQKLVQAKTFFGVEMKVALPAGSDIYFTGRQVSSFRDKFSLFFAQTSEARK
jgi:hypothetical protein